ncbi:MAG: murein L,D-transpeptidase [Hyphomicrobiales bacterium]
MRGTKFALAGLIVAIAPSLSAQAGLLPPTVWEATPMSSSQVLAMRDTLRSEIIAASKSSGGLTKSETRALIAFYEARQFQPIWFTDGEVKPGAQAVVDLFADAATHALRPADYAFAGDALASLSGGPERQGQGAVEAALSVAALIYARHASAGRIDPAVLGRMVSQKPIAADPASVMTGLMAAVNPARYLEGMQPSGEDYKILRAAYLKSMSAKSVEWLPIPGGKSMKQGVRDKRVPALRARLTEIGDYKAGELVAADRREIYDAELAKAVKVFQKRAGLSAEGIVGKKTLKALNASPANKREQLAANMERRRWLPDISTRTGRYVLVNQPEYRVRVFDNSEVIYTSKVIVGKSKYQTAEFSDQISYLVFNPYWNVPRSIATRSFLPNLKRDPQSMARKGFDMFKGGREINPSTVNWSEVSRRGFNYSLRQRPSRTNALGRVKFMFPNRYSIYLHDTPARSLFASNARSFSAGCVRVRKPMEFAMILLERDGWTRARIDKAVKSGRNQRINLKIKVPIYLTYWTAWADNNGALQYRADMYGRDKKLIAAMELDKSVMKMADLASN